MLEKTNALIVPILPMREEIVFPGLTVPFFVGRQASMDALDRALAGDRQIFVISQKESSVENPGDEDLYNIGVLGRIVQVMRLPNGTVKALFEGEKRGKLIATKLAKKEFLVQVEPLEEASIDLDYEKIKMLSAQLIVLFKKHVDQTNKKLNKDDLESIEELDDILVSDRVVSLMELSREKNHHFL